MTEDTFKVVLGSKDILIDSKGVVDYLRECGVPPACVTLCDGYQHGQAILSGNAGLREVMRNL